ncbi:hypothetical protein J3E74DRAFT_429912 [Bipolaris maydis]|nr:hypothetical protein J3E74DRAFT_429912 [Bipolaris maydis]
MTTKPSNGVDTPSPLQPSVATNCDSFYYVKSDNSCENIAKFNGISTARFLSWNPSAGSDCTGLWTHHPTTTKAPVTTTKPGNGLTTPAPYRTGMKTSCKIFHFVASGETCATISAKYKITTANFAKWNPAVGSTYAGLWASTYACVAVL